MFTGGQGGDSTHGVIAPGAGTHHLSAGKRACGEENILSYAYFSIDDALQRHGWSFSLRALGRPHLS